MADRKRPEKIKGLDSIVACTCMQSNNWPFCDGSHHTYAPDKEPRLVELDREKEYFICKCYKTKTPPFCDGSHEE